jgi:hypothetical protein
MESHATYDDVTLILRLYEMRREARMREARDWFARSFKVRTLEELEHLCPMGSDENAFFRMIASYWDMVSSFITAGVLNERLFFQSGRELLFVWERLRDLVPLLRETRQDPSYFKNFETVANDYIAWMKSQAPGSYEAFSTRVRG